jgi:hypothetical protein
LLRYSALRRRLIWIVDTLDTHPQAKRSEAAT